MKSVNRILTNICSDNLLASKEFYTRLFDFQIDFDSDWFIHLVSKDSSLELGIIKRNHDVVPILSQSSAGGFYITIVVDNVDDVFSIAKAQHLNILKEPSNTFYGQRILLLQDPNGVVVDVSSNI